MELRLQQRRVLERAENGEEVRKVESADYEIVEDGNVVGNVSVYDSGINVNLHSSQHLAEKLTEEALQEFINSLI